MTEIVARARTTIVAPIEAVFDAIVQARTLATYFPDRASGDLVAGAVVTWEFRHAQAVVDLNVTEVTRPSAIAFEWDAAKAGIKPVRFQLSRSTDATRVAVTESGFAVTSEGAAKAVQQTAGWAEFLAFLKAHVQFGIELRTGRGL